MVNGIEVQGKKNKKNTNAANYITMLRIAGTLGLLLLKPFTAVFYIVYAMTGLTDVLDGWVARKLGVDGELGAKLDSAADLVFYGVMLLRIFPVLWQRLPEPIWFGVAFVVLLRLLDYGIAAVKFRRFASLHTCLNKLTGGLVFLMPFLFMTEVFVPYCGAVCMIAVLAALEELVIHLRNHTCKSDVRSVFQRDI